MGQLTGGTQRRTTLISGSTQFAENVCVARILREPPAGPLECHPPLGLGI